MTQRIQVGTVFVDAGIVMVGDPCYSLPDDGSHRVSDWSEFCNRTFDKRNELDPSGVSQPLGPGIGIVVPSGYGDGEYPVFIEVTEDGPWGRRVKSVTVEFITDEDEDDEWDDGWGDEDEDDEA